MSEISVSVVIPVKNGQRHLEQLLKAVFSQKTDAKFEVIIIDSGSKDNTLEIAKRYPVRLYEIQEGSFNHGLTRNYAISQAQGVYIVLLTADAIPYDNYWMQKLVESLKRDEAVAGAYSRQVPHQDARPLTRIRVNRFFTASQERRESQCLNGDDYVRLSPREKHRFCNFDNVSSCIRKSVWEKVPFPKADFAEDLEWSKGVLASGYKIVYEPGSLVYHSHDFSVSGWYKKTLINYGKLHCLFGLITIDNIFRLFSNFIIYTVRDIYYLCKEGKNAKAVLLNIPLIPLYSFSTALGQYRSTRVPSDSGNP